ncbi:hypothetical protein H072_6944 [Dactylellina haptotyla CBS 200.50]|uniref:E3 ubiquitin protein ligase n=1 Tax=Dactylellina haptotyla (strain CBS 200.50) TaxID=1284197 RepID=S8A930_DACHA|nr:hypothetical protein H072_6944 [Dactylellina haptotyla CBS 200.50]
MTAAIADSKSSLAPPLRKQPVMEDRKRPLIDGSSDETPPSKRQAMTTPDEPQNQEDVINFQKEAIYRQMKAYKREKELTETRLEDLQKRCTYHDDHIRVIDAWLDQLLDEVRVLTDSDLVERPQQNGETHEHVPQTLLFADVETFSEHLSSKQDTIKDTLLSLFKKFDSRNDASDKLVPKLQKRMSELLSAEKTHRVELERISQEKEDAEQQLTLAAIRYLTAEKRLDRLKSQTVAKIEQQANSASSSNGAPKKDANSNSKAKFTDGQLADAELARKEAEAIASKQEKEIKQLQSEISRLQEQVTNYNLKLGRLSEEDIANCDTYKNVRLRLEDVVAKLNHLEALNATLSRENEMLQAERTAFKRTIMEEQSAALGEANTQIAKCEADLARIRAFRDQLHAEVHTHKIAAEKVATADHSEDLKKLLESQIEKIASLEGEVQRLRTEAGEEPIPTAEDIANLSHDELIDGMTKLRASHSILENEFKSIESAYKKAHDVGKAKFDDLRSLQETITRMKQDKIRNEQKVFEAVKLKEGAMDKARLFQSQHEKATEIIMNMKNSDKKQTSMIANLEKQIAELRLINNQAVLSQKSSQTGTNELKNTVEALQRQINSMKETLKKADEASRTENSKRRNAENELEKTLVRLNSLEQSVKAFSSEDNEESTLEGFRSMVRCSVCRTGQKSRVIKTCGHLFCKDCIDDRITTRNRKCPNCGRPFAATDILAVVL